MSIKRHYPVQPGTEYPPGTKISSGGTNFCIFSRHATRVELLLYERADSQAPFQAIHLDPDINRTFFFWHVLVEGLVESVHYTWRVSGPDDTKFTGHLFNNKKELLDPWAYGVTTSQWDRKRASDPDDTTRCSMRAVTVESNYDWGDDMQLNRPLENAVIYELHVGGFTRHPSANVLYPGTFSGVVEKIPYLKELGITDVELMPIMAFDEQDVPEGVAKRGLKNFWGYSTHSFFSPHPGYCVSPNTGSHQREFQDMVKAFHNEDIGVILDVVFNHTAEGGTDGPTINFKGLANEMFYHQEPLDRRSYRDYSGCGNTINCNHPLVTRFIVNCLAYWVRRMRVDGFRFDLASIFARGEDGHPMYNAPLPWNIEFSRTLAQTTLIAEAWDAAGLYQVGAFPGFRWSEWNGRYRDVIRRYVRGEKGLVGEVATCITGSSDLYQAQGRLPINSINFITCHDGFTLYDLVSYNHKHNEANGEGNRDGHSGNHSWNCGFEGPTNNMEIVALRRRQSKNIMTLLFLSQGVPMILGGDEVLRTQHGNNNAYCQDNEIGWFDWRLLDTNRDMFRFVKELIAFRKRHPNLRRKRFLTGKKIRDASLPDITWHGPRLYEPLWSDPDAQVLAFTLAASSNTEEHIHAVINMAESPLTSTLPPVGERIWYRAIDTAQPSPYDIFEKWSQPQLNNDSYTVRPRSIVVFESREH